MQPPQQRKAEPVPTRWRICHARGLAEAYHMVRRAAPMVARQEPLWKRTEFRPALPASQCPLLSKSDLIVVRTRNDAMGHFQTHAPQKGLFDDLVGQREQLIRSRMPQTPPDA
jgi:hypothetical protein